MYCVEYPFAELSSIFMRLFRHPEEIRSLLELKVYGWPSQIHGTRLFPAAPTSKCGLTLVVGRVTQALSPFHQLNEFNIKGVSRQEEKTMGDKMQRGFPLPSFVFYSTLHPLLFPLLRTYPSNLELS